jgi:hypothetical protein
VTADVAAGASDDGRAFVHRRVIEIDVAAGADAGTLMATGRLTDVKGQRVAMYTGRQLPVGGVPHDMHVRLLIGPGQEIRGVVVEMAEVPGPPCRAVVPSFQQLVGVRVGSGYRAALRERFGGLHGCVHVLELLNAMGPPIMQAAWTVELGEGYDPGAMAAWEGTCHVYAPDGAVVERLRHEAAEQPAT